MGAWVFLLGLLILPVLAVARLAHSIDPRWPFGHLALVSAATFLLYRHDKQRAQTGGWRTPESTLHFAELLGGWPGAFLAQRVFRHKTAKTSFLVVFWAIVGLHQIASFDYLRGWEFSRNVQRLLSDAHPATPQFPQ